MAKFILILASLALIQTSFAFECMKCMDACDKTEIEKCSQAPQGKEVVCLTDVVKINGVMSTKKGCAFITAGKAYECPRPPTGQEQIKCETCTKELCNSNAASSLGISSVAIFIAMFLASRFV